MSPIANDKKLKTLAFASLLLVSPACAGQYDFMLAPPAPPGYGPPPMLQPNPYNPSAPWVFAPGPNMDELGDQYSTPAPDALYQACPEGWVIDPVHGGCAYCPPGTLYDFDHDACVRPHIFIQP